MISKRRGIIIGIALLAAGGVLALLFYKGRKPMVDWRETYEASSTAPYGTALFMELAKGYFNADSIQVLRDSIRGVLPVEAERGTYLFVGEAVYMDSADQEQLLKFVAAGNTAFVSSKSLPYQLGLRLYDTLCTQRQWGGYSYYEDSLAYTGFYPAPLQMDSALRCEYRTFGKLRPYHWSYLPDSLLCTEAEANGLEPIGGSPGYTHFARQPYGAGYFYLHTMPLALSNLSLVDSNGLAYVSRLFAFWDAAGPVYWDRYAQVPESSDFDFPLAERSLSDKSPLQYILSQPPLAWAWYLLLALGLLFLLFRSKRQQRIVPVLEPNRNTSLEFVRAIGRLAFLQNKHRQLALQQMRLLQQHIRERYHISLAEPNPVLAQQLSSRSGIALPHIERLLTYYRNIQSSPHLSGKALAEFHQLIYHFYQHSK